ncbi:hypothetical protein [Tabrizicola sp.]|uniref:hypothetical protein n=1 Tax=Tabrizicola sp. TaxID=2005166 RepID=UPI002FDD1429
MLVKVIIVFLGFMALIAFIGRALFPSALPRVLRKRPGAPRCGRCGRYLIGEKTCSCGGRAK